MIHTPLNLLYLFHLAQTMRGSKWLLGCIIIILLSVNVAGFNNSSFNEEQSQPILVELFLDSNDENSSNFEDLLSPLRKDPNVIVISWHPRNLTDADPLATYDASERANELQVATLPAIRVEQKSITEIDDGYSEDNASEIPSLMKGIEGERLVEISLELSLEESGLRQGADGLKIQATVTPLTNLSNQSILHFMIIEWESPMEGHRPQNVVREWMPRSGVPRTIGDTQVIEYTFGPQYLDPANIIIEPELANNWGVVAVFTGHDIGDSPPRDATLEDEEVVLGISVSTPPTKWQTGQITDVLMWFVATLAVVGGMILVILAERTREIELPRLSGNLGQAISAGKMISFEVNIEVSAGNTPAELIRCEVDDPWKIRRAPKRRTLKNNEKISWTMDVRTKTEFIDESISIHVAFKLLERNESWVMDLRLYPKNDRSSEE